MARIKVYTKGYVGDRPIEPGETPEAQLHNRVVINGHEIPSLHHLSVVTQGADFAEATARINVETIEYIPLDDQAFAAADLSDPAPKVATVHVALEQAAPEFVRASLALLEAVDVQVMGRGSYAPLIEAAARLKEAFTKGADAKGSEPEAGRS